MRGSKTKRLRTPDRPHPGRKHGGEATVGANRRHMPSPGRPRGSARYPLANWPRRLPAGGSRARR